MRIDWRKTARGLGLVVLLAGPRVGAFEFEMFDGDVNVRLNNKFSAGVQWRMQDRDHALIGGLNLNPDLCSESNCLFEENAALVAAPGAFSGVNGDDGNLNYDRGDITAAVGKLNTDLSVTWSDYLLRVHALAFFDPVNVDFKEFHPYNPCRDPDDESQVIECQPLHTARPENIEEIYANGVNLYEAYLQRNFEWFDRGAVITVGNQLVRWGESTLVALNSLSEINPPNAAIYRMPGVELNEIFQPVPLVLLSTDVVPNVSAELVYQFEWKPVQPDPRGSFMSDSDLIGGRNAYITLGQFGENPDRLPVLVPFEAGPPPSGNALEAISSTTVTTYLQSPDEPRNLGQYGVRLNYFADWLNHGTDLSFYFLNYHSRLPYASVTATNESCARDSDSATVTADCQGFNGSANPSASGDASNTDQEPLPIETITARLAYPEDVRMLGVSFNTNIGSWSLAGEYSYRPNVPLQIHIPDLIFMALNPAFPVNDIELGVGPGSLGTIPAAQNAIPSYLLTYRGRTYDGPARIQPNEVIPGYERMKVQQVDFTAIKALSHNPFAAEQVLIIAEAGLTHIMDLPPLDELQIETGYLNNSHYSNGADGTGDAVALPPSELQKRLNPSKQTKGFATEYSWGVRAITRLEYNDVIWGFNFLPTAIVAWDVDGTAPYPLQNFVEGRKEYIAGTEIQFSQSLSGRILYQWFTGGGDRNTRKDRDNATVSFSYAF